MATATAVAPEQVAPERVGPSGRAGPNPDGQLMAQRDAPLGGQAVLEGVMMRGVSSWAVAVRLPADDDAAAGANGAAAGANGAGANGNGAVRATEDASAAPGPIEVSSFPLTSVLRRH